MDSSFDSTVYVDSGQPILLLALSPSRGHSYQFYWRLGVPPFRRVCCQRGSVPLLDTWNVSTFELLLHQGNRDGDERPLRNSALRQGSFGRTQLSIWDLPMLAWCVVPIFSAVANEQSFDISLRGGLYQLLAWGGAISRRTSLLFRHGFAPAGCQGTRHRWTGLRPHLSG